ncbi:unnamed protein product [Rotaria sordida]|uniref:Uncharacterized protein n=1 Tax=Rotaria sordida TaxID=392033 RepID=A0A814ZX02_9BILA|nr:unnamed protein product [Rotaria sordida]CAF1339745.1 unnamed protein product [Rotaria sordida]
MATITTTTTEITDEFEKAAMDGAKKALNENSPFWGGVEWFINFLRTHVKAFFTTHIKSIPIIGQFAARVGTTVTEFIFTVLGTLIGFLKVVWNSPQIWDQAHAMAMQAWNANADNGLLAQIYAYGKKMAGYFLEIIKQCFERAVKAHGLEMNLTEKQAISGLLDSLLN